MTTLDHISHPTTTPTTTTTSQSTDEKQAAIDVIEVGPKLALTKQFKELLGHCKRPLLCGAVWADWQRKEQLGQPAVAWEAGGVGHGQI